MWVSLTMKSGNKKVGKMPVSTTEKKSCPNECPLKDTDCYARFGPLGMHWSKVQQGMRGDNWTAFCKRVAQFAVGQLWRHNQAGDLPQTKKGKIHKSKTKQLCRAASHTKGWTYTHYDPTDDHNREAIESANKIGNFTINLSADNLTEADQYVKMGIAPVCVTVPEDTPKGTKTPDGNLLVICPAQTTDISCEECRLCQVKTRKSIVAFRAHGTATKRLSKKLSVPS